MQFADRVALITGAGSGIGRASALQFARAGARVVMIGRTKEKLDRVVGEIQAMGGEALALSADVSQPDQIRQAIEQTVATWNRLDIVFAHAGINGVWAPLEELEPQDWNKTIGINLTGTFLTVKYAVPYLKRQGGAIVITSSVNGTRVFSNIGATAYASTKAAQIAFAKMIALELAECRVRVNVICPGAITTDIGERTEQRDLEAVSGHVEFPQGRIPLTDGQPGTPEQVAQLVLFLASDAAGHITGTEVWVDGAESLLQG